jgi:hypothetical protein
MQTDIIDDIFLWSEEKGLLASKYQEHNIDINKLANDLPNDKVTEHLDNCIEGIITLVLSLKDEVKTVEKAKEYIRAVLIETEVKNA